VPKGGEDKATVLRNVGSAPDFGFEHKDHVALGQALGCGSHGPPMLVECGIDRLRGSRARHRAPNQPYHDAGTDSNLVRHIRSLWGSVDISRDPGMRWDKCHRIQHTLCASFQPLLSTQLYHRCRVQRTRPWYRSPRKCSLDDCRHPGRLPAQHAVWVCVCGGHQHWLLLKSADGATPIFMLGRTIPKPAPKPAPKHPKRLRRLKRPKPAPKPEP